jgi:hypothetical protein
MWWQILIGAAVVIIVGYAFIMLVRSQTRSLSSKSDRTADDLYDSHADSLRKQRRYAEQRGGEWKDE